MRDRKSISAGKKGRKRNNCIRMLCGGISLILGLVMVEAEIPLSVFAAKSETEQKLENAKAARDQTKDAIDQNGDVLDSLNHSKDSLEGTLNSLNSQLSDISSDLSVLEGKIGDKQSEIDDTNDQIGETQKRLDAAREQLSQQYESMKKRIQFLYERGNDYYLEIFLGSQSFSDMLNRESYIEALSTYDQNLLDQYKKTADEIADEEAQLKEQQEQLTAEQNELQSMQDSVQAKADSVSGLISQTSGSISQYEDQIGDAESIADALQTQLDQQNSEISALEKQLAEERRLQALSDRSTWRDLSSVTFADGDRYLLANLIYCEAGNQPFEGQVAVGNVVINRVLSGAFPDTVVGVIYQSGQFEPVSTGRLALALARDDATDACYQAADAAMQGAAPVGQCLFFRTPIPQVTPKYTIGGHIFY